MWKNTWALRLNVIMVVKTLTVLRNVLRLSLSHYLARSAGRWPWLAVNTLSPDLTGLCPHVYSCDPLPLPPLLSLTVFPILYLWHVSVENSMYYKYRINKNVLILCCACIFVIHSLLCSLYTCWPLRKSPGFEPPGEGEAVVGRSCVSLMWAVSVMAIQSLDKKLSLSLSWSSNAICSLRAKHKQRTALFRQNNRG